MNDSSQKTEALMQDRKLKAELKNEILSTTSKAKQRNTQMCVLTQFHGDLT